MKKRKQSGQRGRQGATGPQGPRGQRGARGPSGVAPIVVAALQEDIKAMRAEADVQMRRIAQLQAQLDVALAELKRLKKG